MILDKTVKIRMWGSNMPYYRDKGYSFNPGEYIDIKIEDVPLGSPVKINCACDLCHVKLVRDYQSYNTVLNRNGIYICKNCYKEHIWKTQMKEWRDNLSSEEKSEINKKREQTCLEKWGCKTNLQTEETKKKICETNLNKYGVPNSMQSKEIRNKAKETNMSKLGVPYPMMSKEIMDKSKNTILEKYGVSNVAKSEVIKEKIKETNLEKYGTEMALQNDKIRTKAAISKMGKDGKSISRQQKYINNLYEGILNYPVGYYNCDIKLPEKDIICEYDGGGHKLSVITGKISEEEFQRREIIRSRYLKDQGVKTIRLISLDDKLPSDDVLNHIKTFSFEYFEKFPNHSWIEWNISNGTFRNAEYRDGVPFDYGDLRTIK